MHSSRMPAKWFCFSGPGFTRSPGAHLSIHRIVQRREGTFPMSMFHFSRVAQRAMTQYLAIVRFTVCFGTRRCAGAVVS